MFVTISPESIGAVELNLHKVLRIRDVDKFAPIVIAFNKIDLLTSTEEKNSTSNQGASFASQSME